MESSRSTHFCNLLHILIFTFFYTFNLQFYLSLGFSNETDRLALLDFKDGVESSSTDPVRGVLSSWNNSLHFCQWRGVTCGRKHRQRVVGLNLQGFGLTGSLRPSVGNLTFLRSIDLSHNKFHGPIPREVSQLFRLRYLYLYNNAFGGKIPTNMTHCENLRVIAFHRNELIGKIPIEFGGFLKLTVLILSNNNITGGIPTSLGNLTSLQALSILETSVDGKIPSELGRLKVLKHLRLSENMLSGNIPPAIYNLSSLQFFFVTNNRLEGRVPSDLGLTLPHIQHIAGGGNQFTGLIPVSLTNASQIESFDFGNNSLTGPVPANLGSLPRLSWLNLGDNNLSNEDETDGGFNFISSLINSSSLRVLSLELNQFKGVLPNFSVNFSTNLEQLTLGGNEIRGSIPASIGDLVNLKLLTMGFSSYTGDIPDSIGKLQSLTLLVFNSNSLSGKIPSSIGNITSLSELHLEENSLQGSIPSSLGNCLKLQKLNLSNNNLTGSIPESLLSVSSLSILLDLSHNSLSGVLPLQVSRLTNLDQLDVSSNKLSGEIPSTLGDCISLRYLYLDDNTFEGTIPQSLNALRGLQGLDLSRNKLSGQIPEFLGTLHLDRLNLSFNDLEGKIPEGGVFRNASALSITGNSKLCGGIANLRLPMCLNQPVPASKKHRKSILLKLIIPVLTVILCLILISCFIVKRYWKSKEPTSTPSFDNQSLRISYTELLKATDGFSSENLIGVGSYGSVYKGILRDDGNERVVSVKVLNLQQEGASKTFMAECNSLRNIRHRNLVKILTVCSGVDYQGNDFKALVFEFMANGSLENWLHPDSETDMQNRARNLNLLQRLNAAIDVASALDYLHHNCVMPVIHRDLKQSKICQTPLVHRDLKPSNILLDEDMNAHVGDFGLAKFLNSVSASFGQNQTSSSTTIKGSIGYVAPEYAMGGEASTQGDVYSFGIVLLEMFTGKRPTNEMFKEGLNLHNFSKMALSSEGTLMEMVDQQRLLLNTDEGEEIDHHHQGPINNSGVGAGDELRLSNGKVKECMNSVLKIGVACSVESPGERMDMTDVVMELCVIREVFLGVRNHGLRRNRAQLLGEGTSYS